MLGFGIMAVAVCGLAISIPIGRPNRIIHFDSAISGLIYVFMNPIYYVIAMFLKLSKPFFVDLLGGPAALLISFFVALILCGTPLGKIFFTNWDMRLAGAVVIDEDDDEDEPLRPNMPPVRGPRIDPD